MTEALLKPEERETLLDVAERAISAAVRENREWNVSAAEYPPALQSVAASFVTLRLGGSLRGCIGSMRPVSPLVCDVAGNARSAALRDPRFPPLASGELTKLTVSVSVLSPPEASPVASEVELLERMSDRRWGWILRCGEKRGLLLPAVWKTIDDPAEFLLHLKRKAQLDEDFWSGEVVAERFTATAFARGKGD